MSDQKSSSKLGLGLIMGTIVGAISAFFLSPKSGKENREEALKKFRELEEWLKEKEVDVKLKEIYGEATEEGRKLFAFVRKEVTVIMGEVKEKIEDFDKEKYEKMIDDVMDRAKKETKTTVQKLEKMKNHLLKQWQGKAKKK